MPASAAIGAGGAIAQGYFGNKAAKKNSKLAQAATDKANGVLTDTYNQNKDLYNPYIQGGGKANENLLGMLGVGGDPEASKAAFDNYLNSTNYNFRLQQGQRAVNTSNAPALNSGGTLKALNDYSQGMAGDALSGYQNMLTGLAGQGLEASNSQAQMGQNYATQYGSNIFGNANSQMGSVNAGANATNNMIGKLGQSLSSFGGGKVSSFLGNQFGNAFGGGAN